MRDMMHESFVRGRTVRAAVYAEIRTAMFRARVLRDGSPDLALRMVGLAHHLRCLIREYVPLKRRGRRVVVAVCKRFLAGEAPEVLASEFESCVVEVNETLRMYLRVRGPARGDGK